MRLYDLAEQYNVIQDLMESGDQEAYQAMLDGIEEAFDAKVESISKLIRAKEYERDAVKSEKERLAARELKISKDIEWLENYVLSQMVATGKQSVKSSLFVISLALNPPRVQVNNEYEIPEWYFNEKVSRTLDKRTIKEHLQEGEEIPGVELVQDKRLSIR